jgi:hypothetical protein
MEVPGLKGWARYDVFLLLMKPGTCTGLNSSNMWPLRFVIYESYLELLRLRYQNSWGACPCLIRQWLNNSSMEWGEGLKGGSGDHQGQGATHRPLSRLHLSNV